MLRHRTLARSKFLAAVGIDCLAAYASSRNLPPPQSATDDEIDRWLTALDETPRAAVLEDWQTINDVSDEAADCLAAAYRHSALDPDDEAPRERLAMRLFLEDRDAFEVAVDLYGWRNASLNLSHFRLDAVGTLPLWQPDVFEGAVSAHFRQTLRSDRCLVRTYDEAGLRILLVAHGDVQETKPVWTDDGQETLFLRPARQDVLQYNPTSGVFSMRIDGRAQREDQQLYIGAFSEHCLGVPAKPIAELETTISLEPIRGEKFSYTGNEHVEWVRLVAADLRFPLDGFVSMVRGDVPRGLRDRFRGSRISDAEALASVKLHFKLRAQKGKPRAITLTPPSRTEISRDAAVIEAYLRQEGVLLA